MKPVNVYTVSESSLPCEASLVVYPQSGFATFHLTFHKETKGGGRKHEMNFKLSLKDTEKLQGRLSDVIEKSTGEALKREIEACHEKALIFYEIMFGTEEKPAA